MNLNMFLGACSIDFDSIFFHPYKKSSGFDDTINYNFLVEHFDLNKCIVIDFYFDAFGCLGVKFYCEV